MRTVDQATSAAWAQLDYTKTRVYFPGLNQSVQNQNLGAVKFDEGISDTDCMFYVGCIASKVEITLNNFDTDVHLQQIEIYAQRGSTTELKIFTGKVYTCDLDGKNKTMKIVAYDSMYRIFNADVTDWYEELALPMTFKSFRDSFFNHFGITQKTVTLLNDDFIVNRTIGGEAGTSGILGRDIIKPLCEANVVFGHIDYDGEMQYLGVGTATRTCSVAETSGMKKAEFTTALIDKVIVRADEEDIGAVAGYGANAYIIQGNIYFYGISAAELQTVADNILAAVDSFSYRPIESTEQYNPIYELGDLITVPDGFGNTYNSIILQRSTDLQRETVKAKGLEEYSQAATYSNNNLISLLGKTNRLYRDIEVTRSTITDVERGLQTEIEQTAEGLQIQIQDLQSQIDGETAYYERESGAPTLLNYPYWDFTTSIPCNNTIRTAPIYTENMGEDGDQYPHFTYTETDRKMHRSDLCFVNDTNIAYRFVLENGVWFWKEIADSEYTQVLSRLATLEATAEQLTSEYSELSLTLSNGYYTKVETDSKITQSATQIQTTVSATYTTKTETQNLQSQITQTANSITTEVTRATNAEGQLSSRITQNANAITAKVSSSGGSSASFAWELNTTNFRLLSNNNEVFKCNSTGITVTGRITGSTITGGTISGTTINGDCTMATNARFLRMNVGDLYIYGLSNKVSGVTPTSFYAFSSSPTMVYRSDLGGYVPVFSSGYNVGQYKGLNNILSANYILMS